MADSRVAAAVVATSCVIVAAAVAALSAFGVVNFVNAQDAPAAEPTLSTTVRNGTVTQSISGTYSVTPLQYWEIPSIGIVTQAGIAAGQIVEEGTVLGAVNGRPVFIFGGAIPAYRSLAPGTIGSDVAQVQDFLVRAGYVIGDEPGEYGRSTARAIYDFYADRGFVAVDVGGSPLTRSEASNSSLPFAEYTISPAFPVVTQDQCGSRAESVSGTLCALETAAGQPILQVAERDAAALREGLPIVLKAQGSDEITASLGARVEIADEADGAKEGESSQQRLAAFAIVLPADVTIDPRAPDGTAHVIVTSVTGLVVEATAIRESAEPDYWLQGSDGERMDVELGLCADGICVVTGPDLRPGVSIVYPSSIPDVRRQE